jgi:hypothetical protein
MTTIAVRGCGIAAAIALLLLTPAAASAAGGWKPRHPAHAVRVLVKTAGRRACPALPAGGGIPAGPPPGLEWRQVGPVPVPVSPIAGPARRSEPGWTCYAHSPMGAVMAAFGIPAALCGPRWRQATALEVLPGSGRQAFIAAGLRQHYVPPAGTITRSAGFAVVSYTPGQASVETLVVDGSQYAASFRTVAWSGGDWKLVMMPGGTAGPGPQVVTTTAGFTLWGGGNA